MLTSNVASVLVDSAASSSRSVPARTMTIEAALRQAKLPFFDARALLCHVLQCSSAELIAHPERVLDCQQQHLFFSLAARREKGEPIAYLVGNREFFGLKFIVGPDVLIPRPETELLVELALDKLPASGKILDLGTGCGNIAVAIALARPSATVVATDVSPAALELARENAKRLHADVRFLEGDWFSALGREKFDVIVSNPPYVAARDPHLAAGDLRFEPAIALVSGEDGLSAIRKIVAAARSFLRPDGWLFIEHGFDQSEACVAVFREHAFDALVSVNDLAGIPRVAGGRLTEPARKS